MNELFAKLVWFFTNGDAHEMVAPLVIPFAVAFGLYQSHYPWILLRSLYYRTFGEGFRPYIESDAPSVGIVIPSLLRHREDLEGLFTSLKSLATSGYQGSLVAVASIDGHDVAPELTDELDRFIEGLARPANIVLSRGGHAGRKGKGMASDSGVRHIVAMAQRGELPGKPQVFFNMDADCEVGTLALDRMIRALHRRSVITGLRGTIVTSHVAIRESVYFRGWRNVFTMRGIISLSVAREFLVAIGLGRTNVLRVMPQIGASGALYCTWFAVAETAPRWARFMGDLRFFDWVKWWFGAAPPHFDLAATAPYPEAMTGMADDTWMSWLAYSARWDGDRLIFALPRTPAHAAWYGLMAFVARPFRYDFLAKVYTTTPTTLKVLFKQRTRWNVSRIWAVQRWSMALLYHFSIGIPAFTEVVITSAFQVMVVIALILSPLAGPVPSMAPALFLLVEIGYIGERVMATVLAMIADRDEPGQWKKLLALPLAGIFQMIFNVAATVNGFVRQVLGMGFNDGFAPESTLIAGNTARIALGYRVRRLYSLAWRSVTHGDVPLGWFWIGWRATAWTPNGYEGWTTGKRPPMVRVPAPAPAGAPLLEPVIDRGTALALAGSAPDFEDDEQPDSGVRPRPALGVAVRPAADELSA
jgi:hypothetical protein